MLSHLEDVSDYLPAKRGCMRMGEFGGEKCSFKRSLWEIIVRCHQSSPYNRVGGWNLCVCMTCILFVQNRLVVWGVVSFRRGLPQRSLSDGCLRGSRGKAA